MYTEDIKEDNLWLMKGDCLERMKEIPSGSVDLILTDPPYAKTQNVWDSVIPLDKMWEQLKRIIKHNGVVLNDNHGSLHPTQKPVALVEYLIKTYTNEGEVVLDFTMGSGTTGVACLNTGRKFIGIERDDKYFDISVKRIKGE